MSQTSFRFQKLQIWQRAADISDRLFQMADHLEAEKKFRFAEQLRSAVLSITNNIAEGSGSVSNIEFRNFLNISRRSLFEVANILILLAREGSLSDDEIMPILLELEEESKMIIGFMGNLKSRG